MIDAMSLSLHPLCTLFPRLSAAEFDALADDIEANGLMNPIVLLDGMILDGGNRYEACIAAGVEPVFREFDGPSAVAFVLSANLHRRHLSPGQQAAIVASAQDWAIAHPPHRVTEEEARKIAPLSTVADRAAQSGASERTQQMADKVVKADPELGKRVAHGEVSLPKAVEQITGQRPGAKKKPDQVQPEPVVHYQGADHPWAADSQPYKDLLHDLEAADKLLRDQQALIDRLSGSDSAAEITLLHERCLGLEGVNRQLNTTLNEARKDAKSWMNRYMAIAALVGVKSPADVKAAVQALLDKVPA